MNHNNGVLLLVVVLVWMFNTTSVVASLSHQVVAEGVGNGGVMIMNNTKKCIDKERHALLDFKANILYYREDPDYDFLSTWGGEEENDCCKWWGVTCNNQTHDLNSGSLEGEISPSLLNLTYLLSILDLCFNSFYGTIPKSIGSLTELRYLDLSRNNFNGTIPTSMGSLTELRHLDLSQNSLNGTIPLSIGSLTELTYLDLGWNSFSGTIPVSIGSLTNLTDLRISNNCFTGTISMCRSRNP